MSQAEQNHLKYTKCDFKGASKEYLEMYMIIHTGESQLSAASVITNSRPRLNLIYTRTITHCKHLWMLHLLR